MMNCRWELLWFLDSRGSRKFDGFASWGCEIRHARRWRACCLWGGWRRGGDFVVLVEWVLGRSCFGESTRTASKICVVPSCRGSNAHQRWSPRDCSCSVWNGRYPHDCFDNLSGNRYCDAWECFSVFLRPYSLLYTLLTTVGKIRSHSLSLSLSQFWALIDGTGEISSNFILASKVQHWRSKSGILMVRLLLTTTSVFWVSYLKQIYVELCFFLI